MRSLASWSPRSWVLLVVALLVSVGAFRILSPGDQHARRVETDSPRDGWTLLERGDVRVSIPSSWHLQPSDGCVPAVEHWGPTTSATCGRRPGLTFLDSGIFDAADEPGAVTSSRSGGRRAWHGYVSAGDLVISASDVDPAVVRDVLDSVSRPGFQPIE